MTESEIQEKILKRLQQYTEHLFKRPIWGRIWDFKEQYLIRFGRDRRGHADITLLINNKPFMIVECKRPGVSPTEIREGKEQLESYLNASRANLGVFANNNDPQKWTYYDNSIGFDKIDRATFWKKIKAAFDTERDIEKEAQQLKLQRIEKRAKALVAQSTKDINTRANKMIDEEAKKRVTQKAVNTAVAQQLQEKINQQQKQLDSAREERDSNWGCAMWGWILFGVAIFILIISHQ